MGSLQAIPRSSEVSENQYISVSKGRPYISLVAYSHLASQLYIAHVLSIMACIYIDT